MHIVIDCRYAANSGIGRYIREIVSRLIRGTRHFFTLIVDPRHEDFIKGCQNSKVQFIHSRAPMYGLGEQLMLPFLIPDCDIFWSMHYNAPILPVRAARRVVTIHDMCHLALPQGMSWIKKLYARGFMYMATHRSDMVLTDSLFSRQEIMKYEGIDAAKIAVFPCAVDRNVYCPIDDVPERERVRGKYRLSQEFFLFVGNVKPHKNLLRLLDAYSLFIAMVPTPPALVIVGEKEKFSTVEIDERLRDPVLAAVQFTGLAEERDLPELYRMARAFVFPSLYEGFGLPPLEAMACGCPVLSSRAASLPEVCGEAALYFAPEDTAAIAQAMVQVHGDEGLRQRLIKAGQRQVDKFDWDRTAQGIRRLLEELADDAAATAEEMD